MKGGGNGMGVVEASAADLELLLEALAEVSLDPEETKAFARVQAATTAAMTEAFRERHRDPQLPIDLPELDLAG